MPALTLLLVALAAPFTGTVEDAKKASEVAADSFLQLVDAGKIDETWEPLADSLKKKVTREQWRLTLEAARAGTGNARQRELDSRHFSEILPNAPEGTYVLVDYRGEFEKQPVVRERVVTMFEHGQWRVCGYFVNYDPEKRPRPAKP